LKALERESQLALFIDFDNVALGRAGREKAQKFDIKPVTDRLLEKGKIVVKKAYADWSRYPKDKDALHSAGIELIEIPKPRISGKNSADIRLVVDAMELSYAKAHIDTFVIISGDSDITPLVNKLRENGRFVLGMALKEASSNLIIEACDEFVFIEDLEKEQKREAPASLAKVPQGKRQVFDLLIGTVRALQREGRGTLYSSLVKDTMKRKQPSFNELGFGYGTFGDLLEDAARRGLLNIERDADAGGTYVVTGLKRSGGGKKKGSA
jgi:uncharacterized protein (TIGR00288 family)